MAETSNNNTTMAQRADDNAHVRSTDVHSEGEARVRSAGAHSGGARERSAEVPPSQRACASAVQSADTPPTTPEGAPSSPPPSPPFYGPLEKPEDWEPLDMTQIPPSPPSPPATPPEAHDTTHRPLGDDTGCLPKKRKSQSHGTNTEVKRRRKQEWNHKKCDATRLQTDTACTAAIPGDIEFAGCSFTAANAKGFKKAITSCAFSTCSGLTSIKLPDTLTTVGANAFFKCTGLTSLAFPESLTTIGKCAFFGCVGVRTLTLPNSLITVAEDAFHDCTGLTSLTFPESLTIIGKRAFFDCSGVPTLTLPNSLTTVAEDAFRGCTGLTSLTFPESLTSIGKRAFFGCSGLTSLTLPHTLTSVGRCAFCNCKNVTSVVFRPPVSSAFIAWSVGNSRKRANWQLTTLKRLRNVLRLVTAFAFERRDVRTVGVGRDVFRGIPFFNEFF